MIFFCRRQLNCCVKKDRLVKFLCKVFHENPHFVEKNLDVHISYIFHKLHKDLNRFLRNAKKCNYLKASFWKATTNTLCLRCVYFRKKNNFTPRNAYYIIRPTTCVLMSISFVLFLYLSSRSVPMLA